MHIVTNFIGAHIACQYHSSMHHDSKTNMNKCNISSNYFEILDKSTQSGYLIWLISSIGKNL
jgi:hypothetical protein